MDNDEPWVFLPEPETLPEEQPVTSREIIRWWERRRREYNGLLFGVFAAGSVIATILYVIFVKHNGMVPGFDWDCSIVILYAISGLMYAVAANICFAGGWISELLIRAILRRRVDRYGPIAYGIGTAVSVIAVLALLILQTTDHFREGLRYR